MTDIATLGLEVKSDGIVTASDRLKQLTAEGGKAEQATGKLSSLFSNLEKYVNAAQAAFAAAGIGMFVKSSIDAALQIERMTKLFNAATGSANLAARELEYVRGVTNKLGLDLVSTTESYGNFMAAIKGSTLEGERGRKVFESVSGATTALGLRADETVGVFKALEQMMSKGKVQAEELRGQLGERLPGAFKMAADAMGISAAQLDKNLALGKVMAEDLLPALADQLEKTYGKAALEGANSAQAAINRMNNAMLESKATVGSSLMPVFTSLVENVFTPLVKLIGDIVRGLQSMAAAAALVVNQFMGGMGDIFSGRIFTKDGYKQSMADALEKERIYKEQMDEIWKQPSATDYTAAEKMRQAGNKPVAALADDKGAEAAKKWASTYEQLRKEIDLLNPSMTELDRKILDVTQKYADLERKKGANIEKLRQLKAEHVDAIRTQYEMSEAIKQTSRDFQEYLRIAGEDTAISQTADAIDEQHRAFRESIRTMDSAARAAKDVSDAVYDINRAFDEASKSGAIEAYINNLFRLKDLQNSTADTTISMISDPYEQQTAMIEARYQREIELIGEKMNALREAGLEESAIYQALTEDVLTKAQKRDKDLLDNQLKQSKAGWDGVVAQAQKAFPKLTGLDKALNAVFKDHTVKRLATEEERAKGAQKLVKDETRSNLSMYGAYAGAAGAVFEGLAATQDTTSRSGFETAKAFNIAAAVMSTAAAVMNAMASVPYPMNIAAAVTTGVMGAIQVAQIASTTFGGGAQVATVSAPAGSYGAAGGTGASLGSIALPMMSISDSMDSAGMDMLVAATDNNSVALGRLSKSMDSLSAMFEEGGAGMQLALGTFNAFVPRLSRPEHTSAWSGFNVGIKNGQTDGFTWSQNVNSKTGHVWIGPGAGDSKAATDYIGALLKPYTNDLERMVRTLGSTIDLNKLNVDQSIIVTSNRDPEDIAKDIEKFVVKVLQDAALLTDGLDGMIGTFENGYARLKEFNDALVSTNDAFLLIGKEQLQGSLKTGDMLARMQRDLFGGMEGFNDAIDTYFTTMFTDAEQSAREGVVAQQKLNQAFAEINVFMAQLGRPSVAIPETREQFRQLVDSIDVTETSGAQLFGALMNASEAFGVIMTAADEAAEKLREVQQGMEDLDVRYLKATGKDTEADALSRQLSAQREIEQAIADNMGDAYLTRLREVLRLEEEAATSNVQDMTAILAQRQSLQDQLDILEGRKTQRELDLAKISDETNRALQQRIWLLDDEKAAMESAASAAKTALDAATTNLRGSFDAEKKRLTETYNAELAALNTRLDATKTVVSDLTSSLNKLTAARERMRLQDDAFQRSEYQAAQARMAAVLVQARGGDLSGLKDIDSTLETLTGITAESYASSTDYQRDFWQTKNSILELEELTSSQLTDAQRQMKLQQRQIDVLKSNHNAQLAMLDAQLNALLGINTAVLSIPDAINQFRAAQQAYSVASAPLSKDPVGTLYKDLLNRDADTAGRTYWEAQLASNVSEATIADYITKGSEYQITNLYQSVLGRQPDSEGLQYWRSALDAGADISDIEAALRQSEEYLQKSGLPSFDVGTGYVTHDMPAYIHQGEIIMDRASSDILRKYGIPTNGQADNSELVAEVRALRAELRAAQTEIAKNTLKTARYIERWDGDGMPEERAVA